MGRGVNSPHSRSDAQDDFEGVPPCQWITVSLERGNLKNKWLLCWSSVNGDTRLHGRCWFRDKERSSIGSQREQRSSSINSGPTGSRSGATASRRLRHWQGRLHKLAKRETRPSWRDHQWGESQSDGFIERAVGLALGPESRPPQRCCVGWWNVLRT